MGPSGKKKERTEETNKPIIHTGTNKIKTLLKKHFFLMKHFIVPNLGAASEMFPVKFPVVLRNTTSHTPPPPPPFKKCQGHRKMPAKFD